MSLFKVILTIECPRLLRNEIEKLKDIIHSKRLYKYDFHIDSITAEEPPMFLDDTPPPESEPALVSTDDWGIED